MATAVQQYAGTTEAQRRSYCRYPVDAEVYYTVIRPDGKAETGRGRTVDISHNGVLFESMHGLPSALEIELFIAWPGWIKQPGAVKMHVVGRTVRTRDNFTAVQILRSEFRTRILCQLPIPPVRDAVRWIGRRGSA